jgi:hypothetical protein
LWHRGGKSVVALVVVGALASPAIGADQKAADTGLMAPVPSDAFLFAPSPDYGLEQGIEHVQSIPLLTGGVVLATLAIGIADWKWGSAEFHFTDEGFFGKDTHDLGMDKLGHAFGTFVLADAFTYAIRHNAAEPEGAEFTGAALSLGVMLGVELLDGFSGHGFAWQDVVMNMAGAGFSVLRDRLALREILDFRFEYVPSGNDDDSFRPYSDYSGQKYLLALKLAGFEAIQETPLRFVKLHAGYFGRGFTDKERDAGEPLRRELYVGIGVNLSELLFRQGPLENTFAGRVGDTVLDYIQVPYSYAAYPYD